MTYRETLFDLPSIKSTTDEPTYGKLRIRKAQRKQVMMPLFSLDDLLPADDIARTIWEIVCGLDMSNFLDGIKSVEGSVGRPAIDPRIHLGLWILATFEGIGSARTIAKYCTKHQ